MIYRLIFNRTYILVPLLFALILFSPPAETQAYSKAEKASFQAGIVDYRYKLNRRFKKIKRRQTKYVIVHTSEGGLNSTLNTVSRGKHVRGRYSTYGGHANYVIARNGKVYRILGHKYKANHAGRSMWDGATNLSRISIGIELVGYHYADITRKQYRSVGILLDILLEAYNLDDDDVLTHSQIAYGKPNRWFRHNHRGRKRCAKNFDRRKANLAPTWPYDPDVRARRLTADPQLAPIFYSRRPATVVSASSNIISGSNTAWSIAGEDYDGPSTLYKFPSGRVVAGDRIDSQLGWNKIPPGTRVLLNQTETTELRAEKGTVKTISGSSTAWSHAGKEYDDNTTYYFLPSGQIRKGSTISDWDDLPARTKMIIGYRGPSAITRKRTAFRIAGFQYNHEKTIYFIPGRDVLPGDKMTDFNNLPVGTLIFLPN